VTLLHELGKRHSITYRAPEEYQIKAAAMMWEIATRKRLYPLDVIKQARKYFNDLTANWDDSLKEDYIAMAIENISEERLPL
jgi:hypothetical protein